MSASRMKPDSRSQVIFMLISAGIFAYFGFAGSWSHQYTNTNPPVLLTMVAVLKWTLRIGALVFATAAVLSMVGSLLGPLLYALVGLMTAAIFIVVAIWEMTNPQGYFSGIPAILLFIFAAWNGYGSWMGLQDVRAAWASQCRETQPSFGDR